jgi:hypothetical protein
MQAIASNSGRVRRLPAGQFASAWGWARVMHWQSWEQAGQFAEVLTPFHSRAGVINGEVPWQVEVTMPQPEGHCCPKCQSALASSRSHCLVFRKMTMSRVSVSFHQCEAMCGWSNFDGSDLFILRHVPYRCPALFPGAPDGALCELAWHYDLLYDTASQLAACAPWFRLWIQQLTAYRRAGMSPIILAKLQSI